MRGADIHLLMCRAALSFASWFTVGCEPVLGLEDYQFDRAKVVLSCDGSPAVEADSDGRLLLQGDETLGFDQNEQTFASACVKDDARLTVCSLKTALRLTGSEPTVIREMFYQYDPDKADNAGFAPSLVLSVEEDTSVFLHLDLTEFSSFELLDMRVDAPSADVDISVHSRARTTLSILGTARSLEVRTEGRLILDEAFPPGEYGATSIEITGTPPPNQGPGVLTAPECE